MLGQRLSKAKASAMAPASAADVPLPVTKAARLEAEPAGGRGEQEDLAWLTHPAVLEAKVEFLQACLKLEVFSDADDEVEELFQRLASWTEFEHLFIGRLVGLANTRAEKASNREELLAEMARSAETLETKFDGLHKVAARVAAEMDGAAREATYARNDVALGVPAPLPSPQESSSGGAAQRAVPRSGTYATGSSGAAQPAGPRGDAKCPLRSGTCWCTAAQRAEEDAAMRPLPAGSL